MRSIVAMILAAFAPGLVDAYVPTASGSCVIGCDYRPSNGGVEREPRGSSSTGQKSQQYDRPYRPGYFERRKAARDAEILATLRASSLELMCRFQDQSCAVVPATVPFETAGSTPFFCQPAAKPWLASRLPGIAMEGTSRPSESLRQCMAILRVAVGGGSGSPEDAAFLADQAAAALEGRALRVAVPEGSGTVSIEKAEKLAESLREVAREISAAVAAADAAREVEEKALYEARGTRDPEQLILSEDILFEEKVEPPPALVQEVAAATTKAEEALAEVKKDEDVVCMLVAGVEQCP